MSQHAAEAILPFVRSCSISHLTWPGLRPGAGIIHEAADDSLGFRRRRALALQKMVHLPDRLQGTLAGPNPTISLHASVLEKDLNARINTGFVVSSRCSVWTGSRAFMPDVSRTSETLTRHGRATAMSEAASENIEEFKKRRGHAGRAIGKQERNTTMNQKIEAAKAQKRKGTALATI